MNRELFVKTIQEQKHIKEINLTKESKTWENANRNSENS